MLRQRLGGFVVRQGRGTTAGARGRAAFTLVELLIVIGILALMLGILLPTLDTVRKQGQNVECASNLRNIGTAAVLFASLNQGQFPPMTTDTIDIEQLAPAYRKFVKAQLSGGTKIFYCPANGFFDQDNPPQHIPETFADTGKITYWWVANPDDAALAKFIDLASPAPYTSGVKRGEEYVRKPSDEGAAGMVIATDQSKRGDPANWVYLHGRIGKPAANTSNTGRWKNSLYGDGHVEAVQADRWVKRWDAANAAAW